MANFCIHTEKNIVHTIVVESNLIIAENISNNYKFLIETFRIVYRQSTFNILIAATIMLVITNIY